MREMGFTLQERRLTTLMRWWFGVFVAAGAGFAMFPSEIIYWLNTIGRMIFGWKHPGLTLPLEHFWQILAVSLLAVLTYAAFEAQRDIRQNIGHVKIIILSKFATSAGFLLAFVLAGHYFAYLAGMAIDLIILLITWFCYRSAVSSRAP